jgi:hypothetical protein
MPRPSPQLRRFAIRAIVAFIVTGVSGCQSGVNGPSLTATVHNVSLQPTVAGLEGGENVCCCHVVGQLTNASSVAVDAELLFPAKINDQVVGTAIDELTSVPPGATQPFDAKGIPSACSGFALNQVVADKTVRLRGLWMP